MEWSFRVGRIFGIEIRLHWFFAMGVALMLLWSAREGGPGLIHTSLWAGFLFLFVLLHELGHCWAAVRNGARAESILLWPLGGLATITGGSDRPKVTIQIAAMGPAVNFLLCFLIGGGLLLAGHRPPLNPFNPLGGLTGGEGEVIYFVRMLFLMNLVLGLFNLLPGLPLDGGRIFQAALAIRMGFGRSVLISTRVGQVCAVAVGVLAVAYNRILVAGIALYMFMASSQERQMLKQGALYSATESTLGHDFSAGYTTVEGVETPPRRSWIRRLRDRRRRRREVRATREGIQMRQRVDELLEKVSRDGIDSLTEKERRFLEEASRRIRTSPRP